jgi:hypothetical protein
MDGFLIITAEFSLNTLLMADIAKTHRTSIFNPLYFLTRKIFLLNHQVRMAYNNNNTLFQKQYSL